MLVTAGRGGTSTLLLIFVPLTIFILWYTHPSIDWRTPVYGGTPATPKTGINILEPAQPVRPTEPDSTLNQYIPEPPVAEHKTTPEKPVVSSDEETRKLENAALAGMAPPPASSSKESVAKPSAAPVAGSEKEKDPNADNPFMQKMLDDIKKGQEEAKAERKKLGLPEEEETTTLDDMENGKKKSLDVTPGYPEPPNAPPAEGETDLRLWHVLKSSTVKNGSWFHVDFRHLPGINPNVIPHPDKNLKPNTWISVAQQHKRKGDNPYYTAQLVCESQFVNEELICTEPPLNLPIAATPGGKCGKELSFLDIWNIGPHDARVLYGPFSPYIIFGSNSQRNCFGMFFQDFRMLLQWPEVPQQKVPYRHVVELSRPPPLGHMEKNWFPFWDENNVMYFHHDTYPRRVFAEQYPDGSVGPDLAPAAREHDDICMGSLMPKVHIMKDKWRKQSIHQATNSLKVTMCNRADENCHNTTDNTFIMHIFNHKSYVFMHGVYEPYVMLFRETAPFEVYAIGKKPIWITGRKLANEDPKIAQNQTDMVYPTSINWKEVGRNYHGYLDDEIILGCGIEDSNTAGMDVTAKDLIGELNYCSDLGLDVGTGKAPVGGYKGPKKTTPKIGAPAPAPAAAHSAASASAHVAAPAAAAAHNNAAGGAGVVGSNSAGSVKAPGQLEAADSALPAGDSHQPW